MQWQVDKLITQLITATYDNRAADETHCYKPQWRYCENRYPTRKPDSSKEFMQIDDQTYSEKTGRQHNQSHIKEFTRKLKGDEKVKHKRKEPDSGVSVKNCTRRAGTGTENNKFVCNPRNPNKIDLAIARRNNNSNNR